MADIRHSIAIDAPRERVFPLIASGSGFTRWWAADVIEDYATGIVAVSLFNRATVYHLRPIRSSTPWTAEWLCQTGQEWAGTRLLFEPTETNFQTQLRFTHADWKAETDDFHSSTKVWQELMLRLKAAAEGNGLGPRFLKDGLAS
jgi:hypothetical protein